MEENKMKRKDVLKFIQDAGKTTIMDIQAHFDVQSRSKKKKLNRILWDYEGEGVVCIDKESRSVSMNVKEKKEKKIVIDKVKEKEIVKKPDRIKHERTKDPLDDFDQILDEYKVRKEFPPAVMKEAEAVDSSIPENETARRLDLRNRTVVTIDGADAKDLDDAVSIEKKEGGWVLGVHIADVSYYVPKESNLDREAFKRANSFYFINKVVPMFPKNLSNGICSLNPQEDRLTLSVFMNISPDGEVTSYEMKETVIHSRHRLTYDWVQLYLDGKAGAVEPALSDALNEMNVLFKVLNKKRYSGGSIDFNFREQKCTLDGNDEPIKLWLKDRQDSERIIEEFMLIANQTVAKYLSSKGVSLYRIHGEPEPEKIKDFIRVAMKLGHKITGVPVPDAQELQRILRDVENTPHKEFINQVLLRSMQQAKYDTGNIGHFGLGFEFYTHYTSPIRRYADLIIHRLIKHSLHGKSGSVLYSKSELEKIATHISEVEREAMQAERDYYKIKAIRFMESKAGQRFDGMITGVASFGIFVQIKLFGVEGMVRYQDIADDYYIYDEQNYSAFGKKTKKRFTMGDNVRVKVKKVSVARGFLDLQILNEEEDAEMEKYLKQ